jgi:two-component system cell cycle response regulator CtrA
MRILIIGNDPSTIDPLSVALKAAEIVGYIAAEHEEACSLLKLFEYDLVIAIPDSPAIEPDALVKMLRLRSKDPIIVLTRNASAAQTVFALDAGADDYVALPVAMDVLLARARAVARRSQGHASSVVMAGDLAIDVGGQMATFAGRRLDIQPRAFRLLAALAMRKGAVLTKEMLLDHLYGGMDEPQAKIIDVFICKLRKILTEASGGQEFIETVWGRGYALRDPAECPAPYWRADGARQLHYRRPASAA